QRGRVTTLSESVERAAGCESPQQRFPAADGFRRGHLVGLEEHFLNHILGVGGVPQDAPGGCEHHGGMVADDAIPVGQRPHLLLGRDNDTYLTIVVPEVQLSPAHRFKACPAAVPSSPSLSLSNPGLPSSSFPPPVFSVSGTPLPHPRSASAGPRSA